MSGFMIVADSEMFVLVDTSKQGVLVAYLI